MKLFDLFIDKLNNTWLFEMAYERKDALNRIRASMDALNEHIIKVLIFSPCGDTNHWMNEINGMLSRINRITIKPSTRKFSGREYYKMLWEEPFDHHNISTFSKDWVAPVVKQYADAAYKRNLLSDAVVFETLERIVHRLSYDIANNKLEDVREYFQNFGVPV